MPPKTTPSKTTPSKTTPSKTTPSKTTTSNPEPSNAKKKKTSLLIATGCCGLAGAVLMFVGDILLYGPSAWGEPASTYFSSVDPLSSNPSSLVDSPMGSVPLQRAIVGGLLGPIAGFFYVIGCFQMFLAAPSHPLRYLASLGHIAALVFVSVYHACYSYTSFIAAASPSAGLALVSAHQAYMAAIKSSIKVCGLAGTAGLVGIVLSPTASSYPRWLILFTPTIWLMLVRESGLLVDLPAPYGHIVAGGSFNIVFFLFFLASTVATATSTDKTKKTKPKIH